MRSLDHALGRVGSVCGLLFFGTTITIFDKLVYELQSEGKDGEEEYFHKPWAMTLFMFAGMSLCLPLALFQEKQAKRAARAERARQLKLSQASTGAGGVTAAAQSRPARRTSLLEPPPEVPEVPHGSAGKDTKKTELRHTLLIMIPTAFDLVATALLSTGLLWVTASVYQMMRGAEMLFTAIFTVVCLKRKLHKLQFLGIACCLVGVVLVGAASILSGQGSATEAVSQQSMFTGIALIVAAQAVQAAQLTVEDFFMADLDMAPMKIVGWEGVFGALLVLLTITPAIYFLPGPEGVHEDLLDTFVMISNSTALQAFLAVDTLALICYNVCGMMVTFHMGGVFRSVVETMRTVFVWVVNLVLFHAGAGLGEAWTAYSWLQLAGFVVLVSGTLVYDKGSNCSNEPELCCILEDEKETFEAASVQIHLAADSFTGCGGGRAAAAHSVTSGRASRQGSAHESLRNPLSALSAGLDYASVASGEQGRAGRPQPRKGGARGSLDQLTWGWPHLRKGIKGSLDLPGRNVVNCSLDVQQVADNGNATNGRGSYY